MDGCLSPTRPYNRELQVTASFSYNSDLIGGNLMVRESRIIADLLLAKSDNAGWNHAIFDENCLQKNRPATAKRMAQAIRKRLEPLPVEFWWALRDGDDQLATQVSFFAAVHRNLLLLEFLETTLADAFASRAEGLARYQWDEFLADRVQRDSVVGNWSAYSKQKMGQVVYRMLMDVGVLAEKPSSGHTRRLQPLMLRPELEGLLEAHHYGRYLACFRALR